MVSDVEAITAAVVLVSVMALFGWLAWLDHQEKQRPRAPQTPTWTWQVTTPRRAPSGDPAGSQGDYGPSQRKPDPEEEPL